MPGTAGKLFDGPGTPVAQYEQKLQYFQGGFSVSILPIYVLKNNKNPKLRQKNFGSHHHITMPGVCIWLWALVSGTDKRQKKVILQASYSYIWNTDKCNKMFWWFLHQRGSKSWRHSSWKWMKRFHFLIKCFIHRIPKICSYIIVMSVRNQAELQMN